MGEEEMLLSLLALLGLLLLFGIVHNALDWHETTRRHRSSRPADEPPTVTVRDDRHRPGAIPR